MIQALAPPKLKCCRPQPAPLKAIATPMATALTTPPFFTPFILLNPTARLSVPHRAAFTSTRTAPHQSVPRLLVVPNVRRGTRQDLPGTAALQKPLNYPKKISNLFPTSPEFYLKIPTRPTRLQSLPPVHWARESLLPLSSLGPILPHQVLQDFKLLKSPVLASVKQ